MPTQEPSPKAETEVISQNLEGSATRLTTVTDGQPNPEMSDCDRPAALAATQLGGSDKLEDLEESLTFPPFTSGQPRGRVTGAISGKPGSGGKPPSRPK